MTRKVILTGIMIFFRPGSVEQLLLGGLISAFFMASTVRYRPYVSAFDNDFKTVTDIAVLITFNICVMINVGAYSRIPLVSEDVLNFFLIVVNIVIPLCVFLVATYNNRKSHVAEKTHLDSAEFINPLERPTENNRE